MSPVVDLPGLVAAVTPLLVSQCLAVLHEGVVWRYGLVDVELLIVHVLRSTLLIYRKENVKS